MPFLVVQRLLKAWGLPVPDVLDADGRRGILLLSDLGDRTLQTEIKHLDPPAREQVYTEATDLLAKLQQQASLNPGTSQCFTLAFDVEKLTYELDFFMRHFVEGYLRRSVKESERAEIQVAFLELCREIASWPRVLCHRDYHSRNLMMSGGRLYWIDFQDARMGPTTYDLASLLRDSYVDLEEEFVVDRAEHFRRKATPFLDRGEFFRQFDLVSVQRNLKALGTFGYMATVRGKRAYVESMPRTLQNARLNLRRRGELEALHRALARLTKELD